MDHCAVHRTKRDFVDPGMSRLAAPRISIVLLVEPTSRPSLCRVRHHVAVG
jgi:hypothetical protein